MTDSTDRADLSGLNIAIVDDNRNFLHLMRSILRSFGVRTIFETVTAYQLLEHLRSHDIDVLLTDYLMPEIDGFELISLIRNDRSLPARSVPIICVSAYSERRNVEAAIRLGADDFLAKPVCPADVRRRILRHVVAPIPRVDVPGYYGPDRRRGFPSTYSGRERRVAGAASGTRPPGLAPSDPSSGKVMGRT